MRVRVSVETIEASAFVDSRHRYISVVRHGEAMEADSSDTQRFLILKYAKELEEKEAVVSGLAGAVEPHEKHEPNASTGSNAMNTSSHQHRYEIRFQSLYNEGRALTFPCDAQGHVEMDALSDRARMNYLYARAVVGREYAAPAVREAELH